MEKKEERKLIQGGMIQHEGEKLPDAIIQMPQLFYWDTYQWTMAVNSAKKWDYTRRKNLYDMYESILLDSHLLGVMRQRRIALSQNQIEFINKNGEVDNAVMEQSRSPWFRDFVKSLIDVWAWGFSAYQFYRDDNGDIQFTNIDKRHIQPFTREVLQLDSSMIGEPLENFTNTLFLGNAEDIGALASVIPWVLWKRQSVSDWVQFSQVFGMPIREYKYSAGDDRTRRQLIEDASQQGANAVYIHPDGSDMRLIESGNKSGSAELYKSMRDVANEEISLLVLGNILTTNSTTNGTQALGTVHEEQQNAISEDDKGFVLDVLNYYMTDIFQNLGINTKGGEFRYKIEDKKEPSSHIMVVSQLKNMGLPISDDYLYKTFGIDKPEDYDTQKKATGNNMKPVETSTITNRALGFFGVAPKKGQNIDW